VLPFENGVEKLGVKSAQEKVLGVSLRREDIKTQYIDIWLGGVDVQGWCGKAYACMWRLECFQEEELLFAAAQGSFL